MRGPVGVSGSAAPASLMVSVRRDSSPSCRSKYFATWTRARFRTAGWRTASKQLRCFQTGIPSPSERTCFSLSACSLVCLHPLERPASPGIAFQSLQTSSTPDLVASCSRLTSLPPESGPARPHSAHDLLASLRLVFFPSFPRCREDSHGSESSSSVDIAAVEERFRFRLSPHGDSSLAPRAFFPPFSSPSLLRFICFPNIIAI